MNREGYCSVNVANNVLIRVIKFVSKSYTHLWRDFTNIFYLILNTCKILFSPTCTAANQTRPKNPVPYYSYQLLTEERFRLRFQASNTRRIRSFLHRSPTAMSISSSCEEEHDLTGISVALVQILVCPERIPEISGGGGGVRLGGRIAFVEKEKIGILSSSKVDFAHLPRKWDSQVSHYQTVPTRWKGDWEPNLFSFYFGRMFSFPFCMEKNLVQEGCKALSVTSECWIWV